MSQNTKILIAVLVGIIFFGGCCCCGGVVYMMDAGPGWDAADSSAELDGADVGRTGTTEVCIEAALSRTAGCGLMDLACNSALEAFTRSCLVSLPQPSSAYCVGVPPASVLGAESLTASEDFCAARNQANVPGCDSVFLALSQHCDALRARSAP